MFSLNALAGRAIAPLLENPEVYRVAVNKTQAGATLIDCGIDALGGQGAGLIFASACMAGLAQVNITSGRFKDLAAPDS